MTWIPGQARDDKNKFLSVVRLLAYYSVFKVLSFPRFSVFYSASIRGLRDNETREEAGLKFSIFVCNKDLLHLGLLSFTFLFYSV